MGNDVELGLFLFESNSINCEESVLRMAHGPGPARTAQVQGCSQHAHRAAGLPLAAPLGIGWAL